MKSRKHTKPAILDRARSGKPLKDVYICDAHAHLGDYHNFFVADGYADGMVKVMKNLGVNCTIISAHVSLHGDYRLGNDYTIDAVRRFPKRFYGYITLNPHYPDDMRREVSRCLKVPGMIGMKLHPDTHSYDLLGENYTRAISLAEEHSLVVLSHTWEGSAFSAPAKLKKRAEEFPKVKFMCGHSGGGPESLRDSYKLLEGNDNLYLDLTGTNTNTLGIIEHLVEKAPLERLLYGSDFPFIGLPCQIGKILFAEIPDEAKRKILGLNAKELFGL
jgi:predicted TIM-barrel fold metal-dependent hydrolase